MSEILIRALSAEEAKLQRREDNHAETKALAEVLGQLDDAKVIGKLKRQEDAISESKANIAKIKKAIK